MNKDQRSVGLQYATGRATQATATSPRFPFLIAVIVCAVGCASTGTPPNEKAESSSAAIRAAEEVGATHSPEAALHLQLAKEQYEYAQRLPNPDDKERADRLLKRAQVDAELALALARSDEDKAQAQAAIAKVKTLKQSAAP
jgi:hypothetical protein